MELSQRLTQRPLSRVIQLLSNGLKTVQRNVTYLSAAANQYYELGSTKTISGDFEIRFKAVAYYNGAQHDGVRFFGTDNNDDFIKQFHPDYYVDTGMIGVLRFKAGGVQVDFGDASDLLSENKINQYSLIREDGAISAYVNDQFLGSATNANDFDFSRLCQGKDIHGLEGYMLDVEIWTGGNRLTGTLSDAWPLDDNWSSSVARNTAGNSVLNIVNVSTSDTEKFIFDTTKWVGEDVITQSIWENPDRSDSEWSFSNNQWTLNGSGSASVLRLIPTADQPHLIRLTGNVTGVSGVLAATSVGAFNITEDGFYSLDLSLVDAVNYLYKRRGGVVNATLDKPSMKTLLEYDEALLESPTFTTESIVYNGWGGIDARFNLDSSTTVHIWIGPIGSSPNPKKVISGTGSLYAFSTTAKSDLNGVGVLETVSPGDYTCFMCAVDSYGNITLSDGYDISIPTTRNFIDFTSSGAQRIELTKNVVIGNTFEIEWDAYIEQGDIGHMITGEEQTRDMISIGLNGDTVRFFGYNAASLIQNPILTIDLAANDLFDKWVKISAKLDGQNAELRIDDVVVDGIWSGGGGMDITTTFKNIAMRGGVLSFFGGRMANIKVWTGGDREIGTLVGSYLLDEDLSEGIARNTVAELSANIFSTDTEDWTTSNALITFMGGKVRVTNTIAAQGSATLQLAQTAGDSITVKTSGKTGVGEAWASSPFTGLGIDGYRQIDLTNTGAFTIRSNGLNIGDYVEYDYFEIFKVINGVIGGGVTVNLNTDDTVPHKKYPDLWGSELYPQLFPNSSDLLDTVSWILTQVTAAEVEGGAFRVIANHSIGRVVSTGMYNVGGAGEYFTMSISVKEDTGSGFFRMLAVDDVSAPGAYLHLWVNTSTMEVSTSAATGNAVFDNATCTDEGDGFMRITLSGKLNLAGEVGFWGYITDSDGSTSRSTTVAQVWKNPMLNLGLNAETYKETTGEPGSFLEI